ncbi:hypothetical protein [Hydrogenophaga sp.]|uniref:hypothetical protein n=1 Tax=Hydrogenophaga sp. TaxID=1904254 RepID=UPI002630D6C9|nr:hypothetical protein [Hydrogenophaga sp.]MDM7948382.1 hypothetical protein [Hydrogenophaga sp.]
MSLNVLTHKLNGMLSILGFEPIKEAVRSLGALALFAIFAGPNHGLRRAPASP